MQEVAGFIKEVGFPIAVAAFVLVKMNGKLDTLAKSMDDLRRTMERHIDGMRNGR